MLTRRAFLVVVCLVACSGPAKQPHPLPKDLGVESVAPKTTAPVAPIDETQPLALDPSVRRGVLPNGMTYYVKANKKPEKRVQLWLAVNAGSVLEEDSERGMAHLLEHIAFEGTKRFPKHDIQDFIERSGMRFGADLNAYTNFDETVYQLMVPTDDPKTVTKGLDVLRDWSADITFDPKEVVDERKIIEEERRTRNSSGFRMLQQIIPVAYQGSKYAQRLPIGTTEIINGATADKLIKLYKTWYRPDLMAVIVVGDVDAAAIETEIKTRFGDVPATAATATKRPTYPIATDLPPRMVVARDKEQALYSVSIDYQVPHRPESSIADLRRGLVEEMFSRLVSGRMAIIAKRATSSWTGASVGFGANLRPVDELSVSGTAKAGKLLDVVGDLTTELARVRQHGFAAAEIDEVRAAILQEYAEHAKELDTRDSGEVAEELLRNYLEHEEVIGPVRELELAKVIVPTITNAQLVALTSKLGDKGRVVTISAPALKAGKPAEDVPTEAAVAARIKEASEKPVGPWQAVDLSQPLISADPKPGTVTAEKPLTNGVVQWTLSNGATVYLKKTDFKKDEVTFTAVSNGGTSVLKDADFAQARFAANIVNASGFGNYGVEELQKKLAGKKVGVEAAIDDEQERVNAVASPDDLEPMLQLVYAAFTAPRKDEGAFEAWKTQQIQLAQLLEANTQAKFIIGAFDFVFNKHPRIPLPFPTAKRIEVIKLDAALAQYRARMANAADFSFVVVGAFDAAKLKPLIEKYVASLPATKAKREVVQDVNLRAKKGVVATTIHAGSEAKSMSMLVATAPVAWSLTVEADADILQHVLNIELLEVLREKLGGTYSVSVQSQAGRNPPQQTMSLVVFESDPARAKAMQDEAWKTLGDLATTPVKADTLDKVREQIKKSHDASILLNSFWADALVRLARYGDDLDTTLAVDRVTSRVTADQVKKSAAQFIGKTNRATITLLPEPAKP